MQIVVLAQVALAAAAPARAIVDGVLTHQAQLLKQHAEKAARIP